MWGDFVDEFRAAPIPDGSGRRTPSFGGVYYDALDGASEPMKSGRAKPALVTCLDYSVKYQYFDESLAKCEVWLAKNYKAEFHVVDELRGVADALEQRAGRQATAAPRRRSRPGIRRWWWPRVRAGEGRSDTAASSDDDDKPKRAAEAEEAALKSRRARSRRGEEQ